MEYVIRTAFDADGIPTGVYVLAGQKAEIADILLGSSFASLEEAKADFPKPGQTTACGVAWFDPGPEDDRDCLAIGIEERR